MTEHILSPLITRTSAHSAPTIVRYGSRIATAIVDCDEDEGKDPRSDNLPLPKYEICPNNSVQCDGIRDCLMGTDETNCGK